MATLPVPRSEVHRLYLELAEEVSAREQQLVEELPIGRTADIPTHLRDAVENWQTGQKSLRTVPTCNAYARQCEDVVGEPMVRTMTGLDAVINMLDDIIDTSGLTTRVKVALTLNVAFSSVMMVDGVPPGCRDVVGDILLDYFTAVFQIPLVEQQLFEQMNNTRSSRIRLNAAESFYAYRARDIDAFAQLPTAALELDPATEAQLLADLRTYRGRRLLFKDIRDVERDLADGDTNPILHFLRTCEDTDAVVEVIHDLHDRFGYTDAGRQQYGDVLMDLENPPVDLHAEIERTRAAVLEPVV